MRAHFGVFLAAIATLSFGPLSEAGVLEDVKDYVNAFSAIAAPAGSVGEQLKFVSKHLSGLMQLAGPIGSFAALAMQKNFEVRHSLLIRLKLISHFLPESEELQALHLMHSTMLKRFNGMDQRVEHLGNRLVEHMALIEYDQAISHPIIQISRLFNKVTDPERNRTLYRQQFINFCTDRLSPHNSLLWINERVNVGCVMPTQEEVANFFQAKRLFDKLDKNSTSFVRLTQHRYSELRWKILYGISLAKNVSLLDSLKKKIHGPTSIYALESSLLDLSHAIKKMNFVGGIMPSSVQLLSSTKRCILKEVADANEHLRDALFQMILMIQLDSLKLVSIGSLCANVSHAGDKKGTLDELADIRTLGINITTAMSLYSEKTLEMAWPTSMVYYAQKTYENLQNPAIDSNTTNALKFAMDKRGPFKFFHNIILAPNWSGLNWYYPECEEIFCIDLQNTTRQNTTIPFNVLITRYEEQQHHRAYRSYRYVYGNADRIRSIIRDSCYAEGLSLPVCLELIEKEFPALRSFVTYRSILFLHSRGFRKIDAIIPTAITSFTTSGGSRTTQIIELFINPGIMSFAHYYKIFFFL